MKIPYEFEELSFCQRLFLMKSMSLDAGVGIVGNSSERNSVACEGGPILEPFIGMEFESEEAAKQFYNEYASRVGFIMRIDQCRRSEVDKRILSRRLSCNRQGFNVKGRDKFGPVRKPRTSMRAGCKAMMLVKVDKSGKWVVTRFEKDHTHPLVVSGRPRMFPNSKDRRIQQLTTELKHQDRLCELYRGMLISFLQNVEEQTEILSATIEVAVSKVKEIETEVQ